MKCHWIGKCPVGDDVAARAVTEARGRLVRRRRGPQIAVASVAGARHGCVKEISLRPIRIVSVTAGALCLRDLRVENRGLPRLVLVTRQTGCRKRRVESRRVRCGPARDEMARCAITLTRRGLVRNRIGSPIGMAVHAGAGHGCVKEVSLHPIWIVLVAARALGLDHLGVEDRRLSWLRLVTRSARSWKRCMERSRIRDGPIVNDVTAGTIAETCGRLMCWRRRPHIAVARVTDAGYRFV